MNAFLICAAGMAWLVAAYFIYGKFLERRLICPDDSLPTPAISRRDDVDFCPAHPLMLWGHHFASIAGAGPVIGPILGLAAFGWGPVALWIALGSVFIGAVHDYVALTLSVRHEGKGIAEVASASLGRVSGGIFAVLLFLTLVFIITAFAVSAAQALVQKPELVIPTYGLTVLAACLGVAIYRLKINWILASLIGVGVGYALIYVGYRVPVTLPEAWGAAGQQTFFLAVNFAYCLLASVLPVWLLLQPRDFLSSIQLFVGMILGVAGLAVVRPVMQAPAVGTDLWRTEEPLWPMLFIIVACGAVSGFHTMVATGTTSKQIARRSHGLLVGYGGMLAEAFLALLVLLLAGAGLKWGFAPEGTDEALVRGYFHSALAQNWIVAFSEGFGNIVGGMELPLLTAGFSGLLGASMIKTFVMTSLDTSTRLGRYIVTETLAPRSRILNHRAMATLLVLVPSFLLAITNSYKEIWKMFGASNQLIAAVTLLVVSAYFARQRRMTLLTLIPALFMLITTIGALVWNLVREGGYLFAEQPNWALAGISIGLVALAALIVYTGGRVLLDIRKQS